MNTIERLIGYFYSGQAGLVLTSVEPEECLRELAETARASQGTDEPYELAFWDCADGLTDMYGNQMSISSEDVPDEDLAALGISHGRSQKIGLHETLETVMGTARQRQYREETGEAADGDDTMRILVIRNFDRHLCPSGSQGPVDAALLMLVQKIVNEGQGTKVFLIMQTTPSFELPEELTVHCEYVNHDLPDSEERTEIINDLGVDAESIGTPVLNATAGLSRAKTAQYAAETIASYGYLNPISVFQKKATHLSRSSKLDVWSPEFVQQIKLWPGATVDDLHEATDVTMINEETHVNNKDLSEDEVRVRLRYLENGKKVERWLDPMHKDHFEKTYRPERDFYSLKSVVGLSGLKEFLCKGFRPDVPDRAKMKHVLMLGVPGTGKSFMMQCCSGEFNTPLSSMQANNLYSKWLGDTDKILARMLATVEMIGGILAIDEFQRFLPQGGSGGESGGVESRLLGTLLTWFNNQNSNLVLSAANNISNLPDEITRSGRVDALMFVGFPGRDAKDAAWQMYLRRHELGKQQLPKDDYWTPADIMSCCRLAELQQCSVLHASRWITPSYEKNQKQMDELMDWAEGAGCICSESGERFQHPRKVKAANSTPKKVTRKVRPGNAETNG
jgi:hypothetical protein